jgi:3D (Asp-Asp-Asp) domain-containing protein/Sec-independent protein translocase protein TatA
MNKVRHSVALLVAVVAAVLVGIGLLVNTVYANHSTISSLKSALSEKDQLIQQRNDLIHNKDTLIQNKNALILEHKQKIQAKDEYIDTLNKKIDTIKEQSAKEAPKVKVEQVALKALPAPKPRPLTEVKTLSVSNVSSHKVAATSLGNYQQGWKITYYSLDYASTGKRPGDRGYGITASGKKVTAGRTIACPPSLPLGTVVDIKGIGKRTCEDRGGAIQGKHIDVYLPSTSTKELYRLGVKRNVSVAIVSKPNTHQTY